MVAQDVHERCQLRCRYTPSSTNTGSGLVQAIACLDQVVRLGHIYHAFRDANLLQHQTRQYVKTVLDDLATTISTLHSPLQGP